MEENEHFMIVFDANPDQFISSTHFLMTIVDDGDSKYSTKFITN